MKQRKTTSEPSIRVAVVDSDPLRFAGFRALLGCHNDLQLAAVSSSGIGFAIATESGGVLENDSAPASRSADQVPTGPRLLGEKKEEISHELRGQTSSPFANRPG